MMKYIVHVIEADCYNNEMTGDRLTKETLEVSCHEQVRYTKSYGSDRSRK